MEEAPDNPPDDNEREDIDSHPMEELIEAEVVEEPSDNAPPIIAEKGSVRFGRRPERVVRGPRLWVLAWLAAFCAFVGVVASLVAALGYNSGGAPFAWTAGLIGIGIAFSVGGLIWPQYVNGKKRWLPALFGLIANLGVGALFLIGLAVFASQDEIVEIIRKQQQAQQRAIEARRAQEARRREKEQQLTRQRQSQLARKMQELARQRAREEEQRQRRELETFATGAADALQGDEIIQYRDDPSRTDSTPLELLHSVASDNATLDYFDEQFDEATYDRLRHRMYALRGRELLAIDLASRTIVRRLPLPFAGEKLVVASQGLVLRCGRRLLLVDRDLKPIGSAPGEPCAGLHGQYSSEIVLMHQIRDGHHRIRSLPIDWIQTGNSSLDGWSGHVSRRYEQDSEGPFDVGAFDDWFVRRPRTAFLLRSGVKVYCNTGSGWKPVFEGELDDSLAAVDRSVHLFGARSVAVRYFDENSRKAQILVYFLDRLPRLQTVINETMVSGSDDEPLLAALGSRLYLRDTPSSILTWISGTDRFESFAIGEVQGRDVGTVRELIPVEGGISVQTSGGMFVVVMHEDFPASKADRIVLGPQIEEPSTVEAAVLPESDWLERMPVIPLRTTELRGGLVSEVKEMADRTEYHLSMPIQSATYDVARQQLLAKVDKDTLVTIDPTTVVPRLLASLPKEVEVHGLRSIGGRPLVSVGYGKREVVYPLAAVRSDFREMVPFRTPGWRCCERASLFYGLDGRGGNMRAQDFRTGKSYGTYSMAEHLKQFGRIGFTPTARFNADFIETEESEVWMCFAYGTELFRARLPQPGSGKPWKPEHLCSLPKQPFGVYAFAKFIATREGSPPMIRVYESQPGGEALHEHACTNSVGFSRYANRLFFWGESYELVMLDVETGEAKGVVVGRKAPWPLAAFPGGVLVCSSRDPAVIIKFKE